MSKGPVIPSPSQEVDQAVYCHLESRVISSARLRVACAGRENCREDYHIARKGYVCRGFELVVRGKGELKMGGQTFALLPGHIFLYGPGIAHDIRCDAGMLMTKYFVDFFGGKRGADFPAGTIRPGEVRRVSDPEGLARLFDALIEEGKKAGPGQPEICAAYMQILLLKSIEAAPPDIRPQSQSLATVNRCRSHIEEHASTLSGLQALADAVHLDPRYICRLFKRFHLPTPYQHLTAAKMSRAAELLVMTTEPVKSVASRVGYADALHFTRVFHRHFGCPPTEFRHQRASRR